MKKKKYTKKSFSQKNFLLKIILKNAEEQKRCTMAILNRKNQNWRWGIISKKWLKTHIRNQNNDFFFNFVLQEVFIHAVNTYSSWPNFCTPFWAFVWVGTPDTNLISGVGRERFHSTQLLYTFHNHPTTMKYILATFMACSLFVLGVESFFLKSLFARRYDVEPAAGCNCQCSSFTYGYDKYGNTKGACLS